MPVHDALTPSPMTSSPMQQDMSAGDVDHTLPALTPPPFQLVASSEERLPAAEAGGGVIQRAEDNFAEDTTFGLEMEFVNQHVSTSMKLGKGTKPFHLSGPEGLKGWEAGTDRGRNGTVLEYESRVYGGVDWAENISNDVKTAYDESVGIALATRMSNKSTIMQTESAEEKKRTGAEVDPEVVFSQNSTKLNLDNEAQAPQATLQVTTLGKKGAAHDAALRSTTDRIQEKNESMNMPSFADKEGMPEPNKVYIRKVLSDSKRMSRVVVDTLLAKSKVAQDKSNKEEAGTIEDFKVIVSAIEQMLILKEEEIGGGGTFKNCAEPLPRRVILPPDEGFMVRLAIEPEFYQAKAQEFLDRFKKSSTDVHLLSLIGWFAHGSKTDEEQHVYTAKGTNEEGEQIEEKYSLVEFMDEMNEFYLQNEDNGKPKGFLHRIANSNPTMEKTIIEKAKKKDPENWASHEIRNAAYATHMPFEAMKAYLQVISEHIDQKKSNVQSHEDMSQP